jgi:hypothetical protein
MQSLFISIHPPSDACISIASGMTVLQATYAGTMNQGWFLALWKVELLRDAPRGLMDEQLMTQAC